MPLWQLWRAKFICSKSLAAVSPKCNGLETLQGLKPELQDSSSGVGHSRTLGSPPVRKGDTALPSISMCYQSFIRTWLCLPAVIAPLGGARRFLIPETTACLACPYSKLSDQFFQVF